MSEMFTENTNITEEPLAIEGGNGKKKSRTKLVVIPVVCLVILTIIAAGIIYFLNTPLYRVSAGLSGLKSELEKTDNLILKEDGLGHIIDKLGHDNMEMEYSVNVSGHPALEGMTVALDGMVQRDMKDKKFALQNEVGAVGLSVADTNLYSDGKTMYLQIPQIFEGSIVAPCQDLDEAYNESAIASLTGTSLDRNLDIDFFYKFDGYSLSAKHLLDPYNGKIRELLKDVTIEKEDKAIPEELQKTLDELMGKAQKITVYKLTLDSEKLDLAKPIVLELSLNQKNRIMRVEFLEAYPVYENVGVLFSTDLLGEGNSIDHMQAMINTVLVDDHDSQWIGPWNVDMTTDAEEGTLIEADVDMSAWMEGLKCETKFTLTGDGDKEEALNADLDYVLATVDDRTMGKVTGLLEFSPFDESISMPRGDEFALLDMNAIQLGMLLYQWKDNMTGVLQMALGDKATLYLDELFGDVLKENPLGIDHIRENTLEMAEELLGSDTVEKLEKLVGGKENLEGLVEQGTQLFGGLLENGGSIEELLGGLF